MSEEAAFRQKISPPLRRQEYSRGESAAATVAQRKEMTSPAKPMAEETPSCAERSHEAALSQGEDEASADHDGDGDRGRRGERQPSHRGVKIAAWQAIGDIAVQQIAGAEGKADIENEGGVGRTAIKRNPGHPVERQRKERRIAAERVQYGDAEIIRKKRAPRANSRPAPRPCQTKSTIGNVPTNR